MQRNFDKNKTIYLIDGSSFLYRAYYGMKPLHTSKGLSVHAVYVFIRMMRKLMDKFDPRFMALVWDSHGKTERHEIFNDYKATRQERPSDLFVQKELIVKFADLIGIAQVQSTGIEADDLINSIVQDFKDKGYDIVIISSDKDLYQLLDKNIFVYDAFKEELVDEIAFEQKMGFPVSRLILYHAILGDSSDNIPGVEGIGKTGATELAKQFTDIIQVYENIEQIQKERIKKALLNNKDNAFLSFELFKLRYHSIKLKPENLNFEPLNWIKAKELFQELDFKSLLTDIDKAAQVSMADDSRFILNRGYTFKCVTTLDELNLLADKLKSSKAFALDTETDGLLPMQSELIGISFCLEHSIAYYVPISHKTERDQLSKEEVINALRPILESKAQLKILHNANFDRLVLYNAGINLKGPFFDTLIAADLAFDGNARINLKSISMNLLNEKMLTYEQVVKEKKLKNFSFVDLQDATDYSASDSHQAFALKPLLEQKLIEENLFELFSTVEMPLTDVIFNMEIDGVNVDVDVLKEIDGRLSKELNFIEREIKTLSGVQEINLNSPKQVEDLLFNVLKLQPLKKSAKRTGYSTDQSVLEELSSEHIVPKLLLRHRELSKLKNTYVDALPAYINSKTGKIHSTYSQTTTATGRLASYDPNLQNIPTDSFGLRSAFKPDQGNIFISADYSQIELRILAYFSQDENLINAFNNNEDIHAKTAAYLFDIEQASVTSQQRAIGKRINFSILYGLTPFGLSKDLKIPLKDAKIYIDKYFQQFPGVSKWMEDVIRSATAKGYVQTYLGRRRYVPGIYEKNKILYDLAKRIAINTPAQGSAADLMKLAMIKLQQVFDEKKINAKMLIQIHDELLLSVPENEVEVVEKIVKDTLENVVQWNIPLIVTTRVGNDWQEVTK